MESFSTPTTTRPHTSMSYQAIAAMLRALEADPKDPDVLLALGVSHVNELDMGE